MFDRGKLNLQVCEEVSSQRHVVKCYRTCRKAVGWFLGHTGDLKAVVLTIYPSSVGGHTGIHSYVGHLGSHDPAKQDPAFHTQSY